MIPSQPHHPRAGAPAQEHNGVTTTRRNGHTAEYIELPSARYARIAAEFIMRSYAKHGRGPLLIGDPLPAGFSSTPGWQR